MKTRSIISALTLAVGALGLATAAQAARFIDVEIGEAPPPARVEIAPPSREGYIYEPGHYASDGKTYAWTEGRQLQRREGHEWRPSVTERHGDKWHFRAGHWDDDE